MPWKGVTVSEQRQRFLEDYQLNYYSITDLAERFSISRKTAYAHPGHQGKWIHRFEEYGQQGFHEQSRRPHSCPWQTDAAIVEELVALRKAHPHWGPRKLLALMHRRNQQPQLPAVSPPRDVSGIVRGEKTRRYVFSSATGNGLIGVMQDSMSPYRDPSLARRVLRSVMGRSRRRRLQWNF